MRELTKYEVEQVSGAFWHSFLRWGVSLYRHIFSTTPIEHAQTMVGVISSTYGTAKALSEPAYYDQRGNGIRTVTSGGAVGY